jgi:hypothetical protein
MVKFGIDSNYVFDKDEKSVATRLEEHDLSIADNTPKLNGVNNIKQYDVVGDGVVGDSDSIQAMINTVRTNVIANGLKSFYTIEIPSGTYIIDKEIKMSPYIKFKSHGIVIFKITFNGTAFWIAPTSGDPTYAQSGSTYYLNKNIWNRGDYFDGSNGGFIFTTDLDKSSTGNNTCAIEFGDRSATSNSFTPVSRYTLQNVNVFSLNTAFKWNGVNHYIGTYKNCHIEGNNHAVWLVSYSSGNPVNAGENFNFENCVIAQSAQESFLLECAGHDISFTDCSFDFNASPIVKSRYSGISLRVNNCYLEKIGNGTGDQLFYQFENTVDGTDYRRNSLYMKNFIVFLQRPSQFVKGVANASGSFINLFTDVELELRYTEVEPALPYNLIDRFLLDTGQNITIAKHRILNASLRRNLVSKDLNILSNGDFSRSALNANLTSAVNDPYWYADFTSAVTAPTVVADGVSGTNCVKWTVNTPGTNSVRLTHQFKYAVATGDLLNFSCLYKTDKIDNNCQFQFRYEYYDANNVLISTFNYYDYPTTTVGIQNVDGTQYRMVRSHGFSIVPVGATQVKPILILANMQGTTVAIDDIHLSKSK